MQNLVRSVGKSFVGPFGQNAKEILYKIRREAPGDFRGPFFGKHKGNPVKTQRESYTRASAKRGSKGASKVRILFETL